MKLLSLFALLLMVNAVAVRAQDAPKQGVSLPAGPGKELLQKVCSGCHGLENVVRARMTKQRWTTIVDDMISLGATANDSEAEQIVNYLAANFSKAKTEESKP